MNNILQTFDQNGAGKTTVIKILMNLVQASDGRAEIFGHDSRQLTAEDFTQIGYVSESQDQPDWMTVGYFMSYLAPFYPKVGRNAGRRTSAPV